MNTIASMDGTEIACELSGSGPPLVLVHGSWSSHHDWDEVVGEFAESFQVVAYDRRGHSQSERPSKQGSVDEDVADLAELIEQLDLAPAWVAGNSFGASITLRLAATHPELLEGVIVHEPPLWELISDEPELSPLVEEDEEMTEMVAERIATGGNEEGARLFIEKELGPGSWSQLPADFRATLIENAPTFLDEARDPDQFAFDATWLSGFDQPVMLTTGTEGSSTYKGVISRLADVLPHAEVVQFEGADHIPHRTHPDAYVEATRSFIMRCRNEG